MKIDRARILGGVAMVVVGAVAVVGCGRNSDSEPAPKAGVGERAGAAVDRAATATKDAAGRVVEKTGEVMGKAGSAVDKTGEDMQK